MEIYNSSDIKKIPKKEKTITLKINTNVISTVVLILLVAVSIGQAVELNSLRDKIATGEIKAATVSTSNTSSTTATQSTNLNDLPDMVGGC